MTIEFPPAILVVDAHVDDDKFWNTIVENLDGLTQLMRAGTDMRAVHMLEEELGTEQTLIVVRQPSYSSPDLENEVSDKQYRLFRDKLIKKLRIPKEHIVRVKEDVSETEVEKTLRKRFSELRIKLRQTM